jgi:hypothetical protein
VTFLLGSFTDGLFGGMRDMAQIADAWESIKVKKKQNAAGDAVQKAMETSKPADTALPKGEMDTPPISKGTTAPSSLPEPDLESLPKPTYMVNTKAIKSVPDPAAPLREAIEMTTKAEAKKANRPTMPDGSASSSVAAMPPVTVSVPDGSAAMGPKAPGVAAGTIIWTPDKGLHPAKGGETDGISLSSVGTAVGNAFNKLASGVRFDPDRGLYSPSSVVGQALAAMPTTPTALAPQSAGMAVFPSAVAGTPPMQPSADLDFEQKRRENMFAIFPSQR